MSTSATTITADQVRIEGELVLSKSVLEAIGVMLVDAAIREVGDEENQGDSG